MIVLILSSIDVDKKQRNSIGDSPAVALLMAKGCKTRLFELKRPVWLFGRGNVGGGIKGCRTLANLTRRKKTRISGNFLLTLLLRLM
jgi:hypothetical protein